MNTDKTSLENENQPSCLGAFGGSFELKFIQENGYDPYCYDNNKYGEPRIIGYCQNYVEWVLNKFKNKLIVNGFEISQVKNSDGNNLPPNFLQWQAKDLFSDLIFFGQNKKECVSWSENYR
jgi:hypothetical protein